MAMGFARQSKGHLKIYSEVGEGTTVRFYLPRAFPDGLASAPNRPAQVPDVSGAHVLVIEDDPEVRQTLERFLLGFGCSVATAKTGDDAIVLVTNNPNFDIFLLDVVLPGKLVGRALARSLVEACPGAKVIFMSGYTENAIVHNGQLDHDVQMIQKPFSRERLAAEIDRATQRR